MIYKINRITNYWIPVGKLIKVLISFNIPTYR